VRTLETLRRDGLIEAIGLCNVTVGQIEEARAIAPIASIQVELGIWCDTAVLGGVVDYCLAHGLPLLAFRPLGGERRRARTGRDRVLRDAASRHAATPAEIALALLFDLSPLVVPLPGPTQIETARSAARAASIALDDEDRQRLGERFVFLRSPGSQRKPSPASDAGGEVVLIMGLPGAGKSTLAQRFVGEGYHRLNRDEAGGTLRALTSALERALADGATRIVLDNTYLSRASRAPVVDAAHRHGRPVRCVHLTTSLEDAQINAVSRLLARHGRLLADEALRKAARQDPAAFAPGAQFRLQRELELPALAEGFSRIDAVEFEREHPSDHVNRALLVWCDGVLVRSRSGARTPAVPDDVVVLEGRGEVLRRYRDEGWLLLGMSWQPEIAAGERSADAADAVFARMQAELGVEMEILYCPHGAGPPVCWCRKPLPGLGVLAIERHRLDPGRCLFVGAGPQDPGFARRLGFDYREAAQFFPPG
jgi:histidinol phosphatase-like enzyme/predicted kinase